MQAKKESGRALDICLRCHCFFHFQPACVTIQYVHYLSKAGFLLFPLKIPILRAATLSALFGEFEHVSRRMSMEILEIPNSGSIPCQPDTLDFLRLRLRKRTHKDVSVAFSFYDVFVETHLLEKTCPQAWLCLDAGSRTGWC